jgi:hypothetical protein
MLDTSGTEIQATTTDKKIPLHSAASVEAETGDSAGTEETEIECTPIARKAGWYPGQRMI